MDMVWQNLRYLLIAGGVALAAKVCDNCIGGPMIEMIVGLVIAAAAAAWGNYVKAGTKAVPTAVADRPSVPTVSGATGAIEK